MGSPHWGPAAPRFLAQVEKGRFRVAHKPRCALLRTPRDIVTCDAHEVASRIEKTSIVGSDETRHVAPMHAARSHGTRVIGAGMLTMNLRVGGRPHFPKE